MGSRKTLKEEKEMQGATGLIIFLIECNYRRLKYQHGSLIVRKISVRLNQEDLVRLQKVTQPLTKRASFHSKTYRLHVMKNLEFREFHALHLIPLFNIICIYLFVV